MVANVQIAILDEQGKVIEQGEASRTERNWWEFPSSATGKTILAEAWDLPGNVTKLAA
jgi:hypothetical protein